MLFWQMFADRIECLKRHSRQSYTNYTWGFLGGIGYGYKSSLIIQMFFLTFPKTDSNIISGGPSQRKNPQGGGKVEAGCTHSFQNHTIVIAIDTIFFHFKHFCFGNICW